MRILLTIPEKCPKLHQVPAGITSDFPLKAPRMSTQPTTAPDRFVFLLLDNFSHVAFANAIEPLRLANLIANTTLYEWVLVSENGIDARCSSGIRFNVDMGFQEVSRTDTILVCGGRRIKQACTAKTLAWVRRESRKGMAIGGLCTAAYVLAKAGLLNGKRTTIHWHNRDSFLEEFPDIELSTAIYVIDKNRYSAAGGMASLDLMLGLIAAKHGAELANGVADQMIYTTARTDIDEQRLSIPTRIGVRHPKLASVIRMMEENLEEPISPANLAADAGMSTRQLERLFKRYLSRSPKRYYMELRLQKARNMLMQTDMSVINVALACGFSSPSHFSKCYRAHFQTTPYRERGTSVTQP